MSESIHETSIRNEVERALTLLIVTHMSSMDEGCMSIPFVVISEFQNQFIKGKLVIPTSEQQIALDKELAEDYSFDPQLIHDYEQAVGDKYIELEQQCVKLIQDIVKAKLVE